MTLRRKRFVRVHMKGDNAPSVEGILVGVSAGHYRIAKGRHIEDVERSFNLDGEAWIPRENVLYLQVTG